MSNNILCGAPFNSILVESNKTVKPCCAWGGVLGDLNQNTLQEILNDKVLKDAQEKILRNEWPDACLGCKKREDQTGSSVRTQVYNTIPSNPDGRLLYFEYNGTNVCNLACAMCGPKWSNTWIKLARDNKWVSEEEMEKSPDWKPHPANPKLAADNFSSIDFSHLQILWLKGGEPFLNQENIILLNHLDKISVLPNIEIRVTTNGTVYNEQLANLLGKAKDLEIIISIDGVGELNKYIRFGYGNEEVSDTENLKKTIIKLLKLPNIGCISPSYAIQACNVFSLKECRDWWNNNIYSLNTKVVLKGPIFMHLVLEPEYLAPRVLTDKTRFQLADYYESLKEADTYRVIIDYLRQEYAGDRLHNEFVRYVQSLDISRKKKIVDIVPAIAPELVEIKQVPLCSAPFNSIFIDENRGVKPCSSWNEGELGSLDITSLKEIRGNDRYKKLKNQVQDKIWPNGCGNCKKFEEIAGEGTSARTTIYNQVQYHEDNRVVYFEFNGSMRDDGDSQLVSKLISDADFRSLEYLSLKGDEPFLNNENIILLEHLETIGVLAKIKIDVVTNGTFINQKLLELLGKSKQTGFAVSIDGLGDLNKYIRGLHKQEGSDTRHILENIKILASLPNVSYVNPDFTVMVYNVFDLDDLLHWWVTAVYPIRPEVICSGAVFGNIKMYPAHLSPTVLSDYTRYALANYYESLNNPHAFQPVINCLRQNYAGDELQENFVNYTKELDSIRSMKIADLVPELIDELIIRKN